MAGRNPPWTRDELILALDLYFRCNPSHTSQDDPQIVQLSEVLNSLPTDRDRLDRDRYRNPNAVYMKLCNFLRLDPSYEGVGLSRGSKLEEAVWEEFSEDRQRLSAVAASIRARGEKGDDNGEDPEGVTSHSWRIISPDVAIKALDKSAFLHGGTGIPKETRSFFGLSEITPGDAGKVTLRHGGMPYDAHFHVDITGTRLRLFWSPAFASVIQQSMPAYHEAFSHDAQLPGEYPEMRFSRNGTGPTFDVAFIVPDQVAEDIRAEADENIEARSEGGFRETYGRRYERDPANRRRALV